MARKKSGNKPGRPEKKPDVNKVRELAKFMYTDREIAIMLGMAYCTFKIHKADDPAIREAIREGKAKGCASLRATQMGLAMKGNTTLLVWLGKQYLDQSEKVVHANDPDNPMPAPTQTQTVVVTSAKEAQAAFDRELAEG